MSTKMKEEYDHLLNLNYDEPYQIPFTGNESIITTAGRKVELLDGKWNFSVDVFDTFIRKKYFNEPKIYPNGMTTPVDYDFDNWETVQVPSNWNTINDKYFFFEGTGIYTRNFQYFKNDEYERVYIKINAANYECRIWINGKLIARHQGGFTPFFVELTEHLKTNNRILIQVNNTRKLEQIPSINYDWFNYGGLSGSVEIYRMPEVFIKDCFINLVNDDEYNKIRVKIKLSSEMAEKVTVEIPELKIKESFNCDANGLATHVISAKPELWDVDNPKLYDVHVSVLEDEIAEKIGFRQIKVNGKQILLNGKDIYLKGVCVHEESKNDGRVLSDDERIEVINTAKDLGCNIIRLAHYPHSQRMAQLADEMGIMLWEEIPVYWALCFENEETFKDADNQMRELILRDRNRASVILWSVGNENPDTEPRLQFMKALAERCKELDDTRLTCAACLVDVDSMSVKDRLSDYIDVVAMNEYYGWYYREYEGLTAILNNTILNKPIIISETGADATAGHHGMDEELFTEEHQAKMYQMQTSLSDGKVQGLFPWILFDFRSQIRLNTYQNGYNIKGLVACDKKHRKLAFEVVSNYFKNK